MIGNKEPIHILLIEDNEGDVFLTRKAFNSMDIDYVLHHAPSGDVAMDILWQDEAYKDIPRPNIILMDINLPGKSGVDILNEIKNDEKLRSIPVIILTTSQAECDVWRAYNLQASSYIVKPSCIEDYRNIVKAIEEFWFDTVVLPPEKSD